MKKLYTLLILFFALFQAQAQDIPLFSQKLTNSFLYNPAVAGSSFGSLTYSFRQSYNSISNAPKNNFVSFHTPLANHKIGFGVNYLQDEVNFLKNSYLSTAFAYHIDFSEENMLSFGVSAEYNFLRLSGTTNSDASDQVYTMLGNGELDDYDFSFGVMYQSKFVKVGLAANRLATAWIKNEDEFVLSSYYSGFAQGTIPLREGRDVLEPYIAFRKFSETSDIFDVGLYYTFDSKILGGASLRKGNVAGLTAGFYITKNMLIGYSREMYLGDVSSQVGATNEFTFRLDFNKINKSTGNFKADYKNALAYRRKTLSTTKPGSKSPADFHKKQNKIAPYSPNKRYQNTDKLSMVTPTSQRHKMSKAQKKRIKRSKKMRRR